MIRVLHNLGGIGLGGSQTFVMELYRQIDRSKIQFDFVIFNDSNDGYKNEISALGGRIFLCPRYSLKNRRKFCAWWSEFFKNHPEYKIIHGHVYSCASVYLRIAKQNGLITICHAHSTSNGSNPLTNLIKRLYENRIKKFADYLFACSTDAGKFLYGEKALKRNNYYLIPNCINVSKFNFSPEKRKQVRGRFGLGDDVFLVGHVGSFRVAKNHEFIVSVFKRLKEENKNAVLMLVGIGDRMSIIQEYCERNGLASSVIFAGNQHDVSSFYSAFDCFLFPSLWEGLPVSVVEAQASGLPCLISDRITKDVYLTSFIKTMSLNEDVNAWADQLFKYCSLSRREISLEDLNKLKKFDSAPVSLWLQEFYMNLAK